MQRGFPWTWLALLAVALPLADAAALDPKQIINSVTAPPPTEDSATTPLAPRDIPARADADEQFAKEVLERAERPDRTESLEVRIEALAGGVATLARRMRDVDVARMPAVRLESLQRNWHFYRRQLLDWQREAQAELDESSADAAELAARRVTWEATRREVEASAVAPALVRRVDDVLTQIEAADRALTGPLTRQLGLGRRGNAVGTSIDAGQRAVDAASTSFDFRLAVRDSAPLWDTLNDPRYSADAISAAQGAIELERDFLRRYLHASRDRLLLQGGFALAVLPVLLWMRSRSRRMVAEDPALALSTQALMRPISAWLVLVLVATIFFQADSPILLHEAALLIAVIPVLRLLPARIFWLLGAWPYAVTALYVLQRLGFLFVAQPLWHRVHLLVVTLLTLGALVWIILHARRRKASSQSKPVDRAARLFGLLGVTALAVSAVSNLLGNITLAELLTRATLDSGYVGLVLFAGASVVGSIIRHVLARRGTPKHAMSAGHAGPLLETVARLIQYAAAAIWVLLTLNEFRVLQPIFRWAKTVFAYPFGFGAISLTFGSVLLFFVSVYLAFWVARTMRAILRDDVLGRMSLPRGVANSVSTLTYYAMVTLGLLFALAAAGFEVGQLAIVVGALGVGIGFGLQNVVNNFVSGLILMFERPIQPGDVIEITGTSGTVREIGMRATTLTTGEGADVVVPNGTLLSEKLINWTLSDMNRRVDVDVPIAYGSDAVKAMDLLKSVAQETRGIAARPETIVVVTGLGPSSINIGIRAWTSFGDWAAIRSNLTLRVVDALREAGIEIPFPQQDLRVRTLPDSITPARHDTPAPAPAE